MTPAKPNIKAPKHLKPATRRWFDEVASTYRLESHHVRILTAACQAWDEAERAREQLAAEGMTITDRFGQAKPHPCVSVEHTAALRFSKLLRELRLDQPPPDSRPPRLGRTY